MSILVIDENNREVQCFRLPKSGATTTLTTVVGSVATAALGAGVYRIVSTGDINVAQGATATATDMLVPANMPEYFYVNAGETVAVYSAVAGSTVYLTRV